MDGRFSRNEMLLGDTAGLRSRHVAVIGLGGVGSWCADALARSGIGRLTLVDFDTISLSNINRQLCARTSTVGMPKAIVMRDWALEINPDIQAVALVEKYEAGFFDKYGGFDYIIDAIDLVSYKVDLIKTAKALEIPIISALGTGNKLNPELLRVADIAETESCAFARVVRRELRRAGVLSHTVVYSPEPAIVPAPAAETPPPGRRSIPGSVPWVPASAGLLLASYVVRDLLGDF